MASSLNSIFRRIWNMRSEGKLSDDEELLLSGIKSDVVRAAYVNVGLTASTWSILERAVDIGLWRLANLDSKIGACFTTQIQSVRGKLNALEILAHTLGANEGLIKEIRTLRNDTESPAKRRNRVVHNPIYEKDDFLGLSVLSGDKKLIHGLEEIDHDQLDILHKDISSLTGRVNQLIDKLISDVGTDSKQKPS